MTPTLRKADNGIYYIHWRDGSRSRKKSTKCYGEETAREVFGKWLLSSDDATRTLLGTKVKTLWEVYARKHVVNLPAPKAVLQCENSLLAHFGELDPQDICQDTVDDYVRKRVSGQIGRPSVPATARKELIALKACLSWNAAPGRGKARLLDPADMPVFNMPAPSKPRDRVLTDDELSRLFAAAKTLRTGGHPSRIELFLWIGLETAARKQAILDLTWKQVDFDGGKIDFTDPDRPVTRKRRAVVPISSALLPILADAEARAPAGAERVMGTKADVWSGMQRLVALAGIGGPDGGPTGVSPHTLRHTAATNMARRGVSIWTIANILGDSVATVERTYAKWLPADPAASVDLIAGNIER